jgi:hypothetical protein
VRIGAAVLTATTVLAASSGTASAAAVMTWTVRPGGEITAMSGKTTLAYTATGAVVPCASSRMSGTHTNELFKIAKTVPANTLAVLLTWNIIGCANISQQSTCGVAGSHGWSSE